LCYWELARFAALIANFIFQQGKLRIIPNQSEQQYKSDIQRKDFKRFENILLCAVVI